MVLHFCLGIAGLLPLHLVEDNDSAEMADKKENLFELEIV
jgi:hypothetical protein